MPNKASKRSKTKKVAKAIPRSIPYVPRRHFVALKDYVSFGMIETDGASAHRILGLVEPLGRAPSYMDAFFNMYKYFKVTQCTVDLTFCNATAFPLTALVATVPFNSVNVLEDSAFFEQPTSEMKLLSSSGGMDKWNYKKTFSISSLVGSDTADRFWVTQTQSVSTTPIDLKAPILYCSFKPSDALEWKGYVSGTIMWIVEYFDLQSAV